MRVEWTKMDSAEKVSDCDSDPWELEQNILCFFPVLLNAFVFAGSQSNSSFQFDKQAGYLQYSLPGIFRDLSSLFIDGSFAWIIQVGSVTAGVENSGATAADNKNFLHEHHFSLPGRFCSKDLF